MAESRGRRPADPSREGQDIRRHITALIASLALVAGVALPATAVTDGRLDGNGHPYVGLMIAQTADNVVAGVTSFGLNSTCAGTGGVMRVDRDYVLDWIYDTFGDHL